MSASTSAPVRTYATYESYRARHRGVVNNRLLLWGIIGGASVWSYAGTNFGFLTLFQGLIESVRFVFVDLLPPRLDRIPDFIGPMAETLYMSYVGVAMSVIISIPLGILAATNTTVHRSLAVVFKAIIAFIRAVPELVFGLLLVAVIGIGPLAGTIALGIAGVGIIGKAYTDGIENVDPREIEGLTAAGATKFQILLQGVWPQFKPTFITWSLYQLDLNIRAAAVLGLVGAGGLGYTLITAINLFQFKSASMAVFMVFALIIVVESITGALRRRAL